MKPLTEYVNFKAGMVFNSKIPPKYSEELLQQFFEGVPGFYVDVGANDPIINSQTYALDKLGWAGLLIEPLPECCEKLKKIRTGKVLQYVCSTKENDNLTLKLNVAGSLSTLEKTLMSASKVSKSTIEVKSRTLDGLLSDNNVSPNFELLSIDVEGHEMSLFDGFSIDYWCPKLVVLEDHVLDLDKHQFMSEHGYRLLFRVGLNAWYVPAGSSFHLTLNAKMELFRKYYLGRVIRRVQFHRRNMLKNN